MPIHVRCRCGHRLICPSEFTGSNVVCPKCGERVEVSGRSILASDSDDRSEQDAAPASRGPTYPDDASTIRVTGGTSRIRFSCPGGHVLHGPETLRGRHLQCPICGVQFRVEPRTDVPSQEESDPESIHDPLSFPNLGTVEDDSTDDLLDAAEELTLDLPTPQELEDENTRVGNWDHSVSELDVVGQDDLSRDNSRLFQQLWLQRKPGGCVDVHLVDGTVLHVEHFAESQSTERHAILASRNDAGNFRVEAVHWSSILRISLPDIGQLPETFNEG